LPDDREGYLHENEPLFLWEGQIVEKMIKGPAHFAILTDLYHRFVRLVPAGWFVAQEQPMTLTDASIPEPGITIVRGVPHDYLKRSPSAQRMALVVEVADSSLPVDQGEVLKVYACETVPVYWIANIPGRQIEVYTEPTGFTEQPYYRASRFYGVDEEAPVVIDGQEIGRITMREALP
jgi:hypothetical protein